MPNWIRVAAESELAPGQCGEYVAGERIVALFNVGGKFYALDGICPHQGGPVCDGLLIHRVEEIIAPDKTYQGMRFSETDLHIVCPWHGWEFNIETGKCAGDGKHGLKRFQAIERDGAIYVVV